MAEQSQTHSLPQQNLQLKGNIYFNKVEDGVYFQGANGGFVLKGQQIYPIVAKIVAFIDAGVSLQDIHQKLPEKVRPLFHSLLTQWQQHQMLMPRQSDSKVPESWWNCAEFVDFYQYLREASSDFEQRFSAWQQQRILLIGNGPSLISALHGLAISGLSTLTVTVLNDRDTATAVEAIIADYQQQLPGWQCQLQVVDKLSDEHDVNDQQVLFCSTDLPYRKQQWFGPATVTAVAGGVQGRAVVSPVTSISQCDHMAMLQQIRPAADSAVQMPDAAWSVLGSVAALNLVKAFFALELNSLRNYVYQVSPYLELSRHPLLPLLTTAASGVEQNGQLSTAPLAFESEFELPEERDMLLYEQVKLALFPYFDPLLGCFDETAGRQIKQVPFFHARLDVSALPAAQSAATLMAVALSADGAGLRVLSKAIQWRMAAAAEVAAEALTVAFDVNTWRQQAFARYWLNDVQRCRALHSLSVPLAQVVDEEVQLLWQFLTTTGIALQQFTLYWDEQGYCFVCGLQISPQQTLHAVSYSPLEALRQCLGEAYLQQQFGDSHELSMSVASWVDSLPAANVAVDEQGERWRQLTRQEPPSLPPLHEQYFDTALLSMGVYAGTVDVVTEALEVV
ncbi:hypothetical protein [Idiomarina xiamenensis]|uniref:Thiazole-containing bacteriocin maturation protein n=1 Tax=Idiomarina xiamenensis 10-D-4 TaxID=740709 RepID=K2JVX0_9GAMM|nr:hypothetical protein [Idiomarina xiamenensis]EKE87551.1 hypothetical protein A10D4_00615 [Idiomarina xiamenensis 10-D-4]